MGPMTRDWYAWLIDPVDTTSFEREFYERQPCRIGRDSHEYYRELLTVTDLDTVLGSHGVSYPDISLVSGETEIVSSEYTNDTGKIQPLEVVRRFDEGATIIFRQLHKRVPALGRLCVALGQRFASRVQTNVYLTPPGAQGFALHWDTHDVFVLQVGGSKLWSLYDTKVTLPLRGQRFEPGATPPTQVTDEFELAAGSALYVPRGLMHSARSTDDTSLHITLGITAFTWADFLIESVAAAALDDEALRHNLPGDFAREDFPAAERVRLYREKLALVRSQFDPEVVWRHLKDEVLASNVPVFTNLLGQRMVTDPVAPATRVRQRSDLFVECRQDEDMCVLRFAGQELRLPVAARPAVEFVLATAEFVVQDLPDCLDTDGKVTLVTRLLREGVLYRT